VPTDGDSRGPIWRRLAAGLAHARRAVWLFVGLASVAGAVGAPHQPAFFPSGASAYVIEVDGTPRWSLAADRQLPPASLTKLMTALVVVERDTELDGVATVSARAAQSTGTRLGLRVGEQMPLKDLLGATLVKSANDACLVLAEYVGGTEVAFVALMNQRAAELGLRHTNFANACGHDDPRHWSSAGDLARLATVAMDKPRIAQYVQLERIRVVSLTGRRWDLTNSNHLLGRYAGTDGVKTGYTPEAGRCLIARVRRNHRMVLLVVLGAVNRWWETEAALDGAFEAASSPNTNR